MRTKILRGISTAFFLLALPLGASAGSQTYTTPGSYAFTVPSYGSLTVQVWGGGGAGGGFFQYASGGPGGTSSFGSALGATGGSGGAGVTRADDPVPRPGGPGGAGYGGTTNATGGSGLSGSPGQMYAAGCPGPSGAGGAAPAGGAGGAAVSWTATGKPGAAPGGGASGGAGATMYSWPENGGNYYECATAGGGGGGGYAARTYSTGQLTAGSTVTVTVGGGGAPWLWNGQTYNAAGGYGAPGQVAITWTDPPPASCAVSVTPNTINQGSGTTLSWSTTNANTWVYINNVGYVGASGAVGVYPSVTTDYACYALGSGGSDGWHSAVVTVNQSCALPWGGTIANGQSTTAYQNATVPYGSSCLPETRTCTNGTLSGTYTNQSCSVGDPASCTLNGITISHGQSRTFYSSQISPIGQLCSAVSQTRTCTNGTLSGSDAYQYGTCTCAPVYSCSGNNVQYTNSSCVTSTVAACTAPAYCSAGQSACVNPEPEISGHLEVLPGVVRSGDTTKVYWDVSNVQSCSVVGTNGNSWTGLTSGASGKTTSPIMVRTTFTLTCLALAGTSPSSFSETATVVTIPVFQEQ